MYFFLQKVCEYGLLANDGRRIYVHYSFTLIIQTCSELIRQTQAVPIKHSSAKYRTSSDLYESSFICRNIKLI